MPPSPRLDARFASVVEVEPATSEPLTLKQVKDHLVIHVDEFDAALQGMIATARQAAEVYMDRSLISRDWIATMDRFPGGGLFLADWDGVKQGHLGTELARSSRGSDPRSILMRKGQLTAVRSVATFDDDDDRTVFAASKYFVDKTSEPGRIVLREGSTWPIPERVANGVEIIYTAGWKDAGEIPRDIAHGLLIHVAALWENKGKDLSKQPDVSVASAWYDTHPVGGRDLL